MKFKDMKKHKNTGQVPEFGAIFMSDSSTKEECFERKLFGLPYGNANFVMKVKAGMVLFLFEYSKRELYGVFQATSDGQMSIVPSAYTSSGKSFPAQVRFTTIWECHEPLAEHEFGEAISDNYFSAYKFNFGLSRDQVCRLLWLFDSRRVGVPKHGHLSLGDPEMTCRKPKYTYCNLSSDSNVVGLHCSSTSAANCYSSSVSASQEEPKNLKTDLGDFIPLSSFSHSGSASTTDKGSCSSTVEFSEASSKNLEMVDVDGQDSESDDYLGVKGLYCDRPTQGCSVFSRLNMSSKGSPHEQAKRRGVSKSVLHFIEGMKQMQRPSTQRAQVREIRAKVDKSVLEIIEELQQKHEKWSTKENRDLSVRKRSVFSRLEVASKHDFEGDRSLHGVREELHQHGLQVERPRHKKGRANNKEESEVCMSERRTTVFSRLNWGSETQLLTSDHQEVKLSEHKENFESIGHMKNCKFPPNSKATNSGDILSSQGMVGERSGLSHKGKSELLKAESELEKSGYINGNQHKKRRVNPMLSKKSSEAETVVPSQELPSKKEKEGDTNPMLSTDKTDDIELPQKGEVSSVVLPLDCIRNDGELSKSSNEKRKLGELVAKDCYGDVTTRKILKTYKRRHSIALPTVKACDQKIDVEEGHVMCSEPYIKADRGVEYSQVLFPEIVVPTECFNH